MGGCQGGRRERGIPWWESQREGGFFDGWERYAALGMIEEEGRFAALGMTCGEEEGRFPNRPYGNDGWERYAALGMTA